MGGLLCCCWRMFCCECSICEKKDTWKIDDEIRPGELGAGYLYKKAKNSAMWSKRYFVLTEHKLKYYLERDRTVEKGEIILAGATASVSSTRSDSKKKFYFYISHPQCGVRELSAKSNNRRMQWIDRINQVSQNLLKSCVYGKLLKQGGLSKNVWQERWCISTRDTIDYFEAATDNQSKGTIVITNATINPVKIKDKFCFEVTATGTSGKKSNKKYVFAAEKEYDRDRWVECLVRNSKYIATSNAESEATNNNNTTNNDEEEGGANSTSSNNNNNPLHRSNTMNTEDGIEMEDTDSTINLDRSFSNSSQLSIANNHSLEGYLLKKSPAVLKGWQKRYFVTEKNGDIAYYKNEAEARQKGEQELRGVIRLKDIMPQPLGVQYNEKTFELTLTLQTKKIQLKAQDAQEVVTWAQNIIHLMELYQQATRK